MSRYKIDPFLYTNEEKLILKALITQHTPLKISSFAGIPRSTVYFVLEKLRTRGLVKKEKTGKKVSWYLKKNELTDFKNEQSNNEVKIYDSKELIEDFLSNVVFKDSERIKTLSGDTITQGWNQHVGRDKIITFNNYIKENNLISDHITSEKPIREHIELWGDDWVNSFQEKPTEYHVLEKEYTNHGGQIFIKNKKVYIINMNKPLIVEIIDPEVAKMFLLMFEFIKDHSKKVNVTDFLNKLK